MDTERWQILLKAIDRGSLRAAAEEMGFTVSGISRSVATLEKELGFALLHRAKSGVQPTAECRQLLPSVRELLFAQERLEQTAAKVRGADCGTIVIGTAYNCYYEWVTRMMAAFRTRHPGVVIKIVNGTSSELAEMLLDHRTDFCLISHRDSLPVWLPIRQDELMVLLPKNHPLADRESFPVESLKTEPFIDSYPGMETDITLIFDKLKARPDARYSTMDITATYAMVSAGLGISVNNAINHQDGYPGVVERLDALTARAAFAAMLLSALVARIGLGIVQTEPRAVAGNLSLRHVGVGGHNRDAVVGSGTHCRRHGAHKRRAAVGIYGMVARMVCNHHVAQPAALCQSARHSEHYAVAERHHRGFHVLVVVVSFGYRFRTLKQRAFEILSHKIQRNHDMLYAQTLAVHPGELDFATVVV